MRSVASVCLLLAACGPVLLGGDDAPRNQAATPMPGVDAGPVDSGGSGMPAPAAVRVRDDLTAPSVLVSVKPLDCGRCFELMAIGAGGIAPYRFEWDDGSQSAQRRVCVDQVAREVSVIVQDATAARSSAYVTRLETEADASCSMPKPAAKLCVANPSFEGAPAANLGLPETFDAAPWSVCTDPSAANASTANMPDIASDTVTTGGTVPKATDGNTFLALTTGEQVSQALCEKVRAGTELNLKLDLSRIDLGGGTSPGSDPVVFEIWGGVAADCSQRQKLWASAAVEVGWKSYCVKLAPAEFMDQITLRANGTSTGLTPLYLAVDNLVPVDDCP